MSKRAELAQAAAEMYYLNLDTMDSIARALGVSRSTVSRLLAFARETGIVRISVDSVSKSDTALALEDTFGINVVCVPIRRPLTAVARLSTVAKVAAERLNHMVTNDQVIGVAWGNTTSEVLRHVTPSPRENVTVVQLNGSTSLRNQGYTHADTVLSRAVEVFDAEIVPFPVPAFFDYVETKQAMWKERAVLSVVDLIHDADLMVFGVGAFHSSVPSLVYSGGYLESEQVAELSNDGVVGDVCTVLLREDGTYEDIELNKRASGPTPKELMRVDRRLCVVAGQNKASALLGALRTGVVTDLVVDEDTGRATLERARATSRRRKF
ncbi:sugar-binding transcriptional regulator [Boudabousia marimammalium]|uniref:Transcriptional regulator n=1 Tax=Boudabousia marimammalium TaxID=156892 RepID=A0A1Q5PLB5_9ACTO|nr:sugar-binding domain-containing protein [Boudabousia marimammalium]OKL47391.1 transcriptional regulator [Boudabousia marimammalium]